MSTAENPIVKYVEGVIAEVRQGALAVLGLAGSQTYTTLGQNLAALEALLERATELAQAVDTALNASLQAILQESTRQGLTPPAPTDTVRIPAQAARHTRLHGVDPYAGLTLDRVLRITAIPAVLESRLRIPHLLRAIHWVPGSSAVVWALALRNIVRGMPQTKLANLLRVRQGDAMSGLSGHVNRVCVDFLGFTKGQTISTDHPLRVWFLDALVLQADKDVWTAVFDILSYMPLVDTTWDSRTIPPLNDIVDTYPTAAALAVLNYRASHSGPSKPSPEHTTQVCADLGMTEAQLQEAHVVLDKIAAGVMLHVMELVPGTWTFPNVEAPFWKGFVNSPHALGMLDFWGPFGSILSCMNSAGGAVALALNPLQPMPHREARGCAVSEDHLVVHADPTR